MRMIWVVFLIQLSLCLFSNTESYFLEKLEYGISAWERCACVSKGNSKMHFRIFKHTVNSDP